jgi:hypothetical protein
MNATTIDTTEALRGVARCFDEMNIALHMVKAARSALHGAAGYLEPLELGDAVAVLACTQAAKDNVNAAMHRAESEGVKGLQADLGDACGPLIGVCEIVSIARDAQKRIGGFGADVLDDALAVAEDRLQALGAR